ncbi:hypothetical protein, partial [Aeromonas veronii]|uniref:hypothetical protein n=1 Tax=Aeromonas veronii TaxID=654 RepID=UPI003BA2EFB0
MVVDLKVMAYFKISLSTRNWDRAIKKRLHKGGVVDRWLSGRVMVSGGFKQLLVGHQIDGVK